MRAAVRPRPTPGRARRSWPRRTATGTGRRAVRGSRWSATRCCAAHAARSRGGWTRSRRRAGCSTSARATASCSTRWPAVGASRSGWSAARAARTCASSRWTSSRASGRPSSSGTRSSTFATQVRRFATRRACSVAAASPSSRCRTPTVCRRVRSATAGCIWTCHVISSISAARTLRAGLEQHGLRVERESHVRGGQIVIGWLDGLVGSLPGDLRLYQAAEAPRRAERPRQWPPPGRDARRGDRPAAGGRRMRRRRGLAAARRHRVPGGAAWLT